MQKVLSAAAAMALAVVGLAAVPAQAHVAVTAAVPSECENVIHKDLDGIDTTADPDEGEPAVRLVAEGLEIGTTVFSGQGATWWQDVDPVPLADVTGLSYDITTGSAATAGGSGSGVGPNLPAYLLEVRLADDTEATLVYEPYYSDEWGTGNEYVLDLVGETTTWDVSGAGTWWSNEDGLAGIGGGGSYASNQTLTQIATEREGITVTGFGFQQTWADGLTATVNNVHFESEGGCQNHAWEPPPLLSSDHEVTGRCEVVVTATNHHDGTPKFAPFVIEVNGELVKIWDHNTNPWMVGTTFDLSPYTYNLSVDHEAEWPLAGVYEPSPAFDVPLEPTVNTIRYGFVDQTDLPEAALGGVDEFLEYVETVTGDREWFSIEKLKSEWKVDEIPDEPKAADAYPWGPGFWTDHATFPEGEVTVDCRPVAEPEGPTITYPACEEPGVVSIPEVEGVGYSGADDGQELPDGDEVTVTAAPLEGYLFPDGADTSWTLTSEVEDCPVEQDDGGENTKDEDGTDSDDGEDRIHGFLRFGLGRVR